MAAHVAAAAPRLLACRWNRVAPLPTSPSRRPLQAQAAARMDRPRHAVVVRCKKKKKGAADEPAGELGPEEGGDPHQDDTPFNYEINKIRGYWTEIHSAKISYLTVRMYVSTFVKTAEDTYHRKVDRATILSFLCALQGLAAVSHILFEDALAFVRSSQPDYSPNHDVEVINRYYQQEIKRLINNFREASTTEALEAAPLHPVMLPHQMTGKMSS
uniref:Uncharacterized protein n=1 Tax=Oryza nivara TaxID=4536 RepID=A0A0E0I5G4_ORYNI